MTSVPVPRRTQAERRALTRDALLQATIGCLIDLGYAGTTTSEIQRRAGVSRGALTHHFAAKSDLLVATVNALYDDVSAGIHAALTNPLNPPADETSLRPAILTLWNRFSSPLFCATTELRGAARTDPELRSALLPHELRLDAELTELTEATIGRHLSARPTATALCHILMTSMRGQAMSSALRPPAAGQEPHLQQWFELAEALT